MSTIAALQLPWPEFAGVSPAGVPRSHSLAPGSPTVAALPLPTALVFQPHAGIHLIPEDAA